MAGARIEGAAPLQVVTELRNRGVQDIFIARVDGLGSRASRRHRGRLPKAVVQLRCIVHMVRHSLNYYVSWKRRKEVAADLRCI